MKKLISCVLSLVLALSLVPSAFAAEGASVDKFTDVPADAWYRDELAYALHNGYISGTSETTFAPDALVTRGQFVTIMGRMLGANAGNGKTQFTDVPEKAFYAPYVGWAASKGYVNGTSATTFAPDANITFEQMGTIIANHLNKSGVVVVATLPPTTYKDASSIAGWAKGNMELMAKYNLLPTDAVGNVNPRNQVTRAEAAVSLVRLAQATGLGQTPPVNGNQSGTDWGKIDITGEATAMARKVHDELWASGAINSSMTQKEKAIEYFRWMCTNCQYKVGDAAESVYGYPRWVVDYAYGPLVLGIGECDGLSYAYMELLKTEGITCSCKADEVHMWNEVVFDSQTYTVDMTQAVLCTCNADGSLNETLFVDNVQKQFYPDDWESSMKPLEW